MSRTLKYDIPGRDFRVRPVEVIEKGWEAIFSPDLRPPLKLVVDIGFGRGEFIRDLATDSPDVAHVGIERMFKRVLKVARRVAQTDIGNLRLVEGAAEMAIEELFDDATVETFWVNYPDPWPKARHVARRIVQSEFVREAANKLIAGGTLLVATDDLPYAEQMDHVLSCEPLLENTYAPRAWLGEAPDRPPTTYELVWRERGRPLHFFAYRRRSNSPELPSPGR